MTDVQPFEAVRRDIIRLWKTKRRLLCAVESLPPSSPVRRAIQNLGDPTCKLRLLADRAVCKFADRYGDDLFRKEVDGIHLVAPENWFYGISDQIPEESVDKTPISREVIKLECLHGHARNLVDSVSALPFVSSKEIARQSEAVDKAFAHARSRVADNSPAFTGYLLIAARLCPGIADAVLAFCD